MCHSKNLYRIMLSIRLEPELEERLNSLAKETGCSKSYHAREAIRQYLAACGKSVPCGPTVWLAHTLDRCTS
jgi:hypothetical protein